MKSRPSKSPNDRKASEQLPDAGQPRPRLDDPAAPFDPANEPGPLNGPDTEKLFADINELLAIGRTLSAQNEVQSQTIVRLCTWILGEAPRLSAAGTDIAGLTAIVAESLAAAQTSTQQDQDNG